MALVYGRLVPLHRVLAAALESSPSGDFPASAAQLDTLPLSSANVDPEGVYLLENGAEAWLYFGGATPPQLVADLLGEPPVGFSKLRKLWRAFGRTVQAHTHSCQARS